MKKIKIALVALSITAAFGCRRGSHVVISSSDNNTKIKLEYWGNVKLNNDQTAIASISHGGFVDYKKNDDEIRVTNGKNGLFSYEQNGSKAVALDADGRALLSEAIQKIAKVQSGH